MTVSEGKLHLKQYIYGKPAKLGIKAWEIADNANSTYYSAIFTKGKMRPKIKTLLSGEQAV
jgi:hypothetical protein